ncbi:MAG TPA: peptidylprolyl isomerase, partial [Gammaproteobacteria bacterium]|nr:peptidylprolyl isomerase [Gammaproteobacteria bacterium]
GTIFHRVVPGFVIQGGGFTTALQEKPTRPPIADEAANGLANLRGTIAMARKRNPDSATSQFYINLADNPMLDFRFPDNPGYAVFGHVVSGMDVVERIAKQPTGAGGPFSTGVPATPIVIEQTKLLAP